jgi:hypothetical protein
MLARTSSLEESLSGKKREMFILLIMRAIIKKMLKNVVVVKKRVDKSTETKIVEI